MKIQLFPFVFVFFALTLSCQKKADQSKPIQELYKHLVEQKKYCYQVQYSEGLSDQKPVFQLFGTGKLTRSSYGALSAFYFGLTSDEKDNYLQLIRNDNQSIEILTSATFDEIGIDVLADSLHSAVLLNPEWLKTLIEKADKISVAETATGNSTEFEFAVQKRRIVVNSSTNNELMQLSVFRKTAGNNDYVRKWNFKHLDADAYQDQVATYERQLKAVQRNFL